uniref:Uncharacterized protein n=1 Tax=uncultured marine virus TaxID=186617 RepID=A0A0F7L3H1_9VIRU|nr:hypothetical protein [uncultured marine virus]
MDNLSACLDIALWSASLIISSAIFCKCLRFCAESDLILSKVCLPTTFPALAIGPVIASSTIPVPLSLIPWDIKPIPPNRPNIPPKVAPCSICLGLASPSSSLE